ncbi:DUF4880 domain-containing protein [Pseudomonas sp. DWRC2-2]|uniref:DUF4880 domain-containing protein n=1 Tax=Pseudomonas sp. DWRC2-2 TaxID=2804567 RepID=UPI003CE73B2F
MNKPDPIAQKAIEWLVLLHSGDMTPSQHDEFLQWRAQDQVNDEACRSIEHLLERMPQLAASPALRQNIQNRSNRRQFLRNTLALSALATLTGTLYNQYTPLSGVFADLTTRTGERTSQRLTDGTTLTLNARSAVDVKVGQEKRAIELLQGLIHIVVLAGQSPMVISTRDGQISLEQGTLTIGLQSEKTSVAVLDRQVNLISKNGQLQRLVAGQGILMGDSILKTHKIDIEGERAWLNGFVQLNDQPLALLIDRLRDYRSGVLRLDPDIANIRVSGIFPLDDTDVALETLEQTLPVRVNRRTNYWVSISRQA